MRARPNDSGIGDSGGHSGRDALKRQTHTAVGASA